MKVIPKLIKFQWDNGNTGKNLKHSVSDQEAEEVFLDKKKKIFKDHLHSSKEERFRVIGKTKQERLLFIVFAVRPENVRVISARDINRKEVSLYEKKASITQI